jgi:cytochrome c553
MQTTMTLTATQIIHGLAGAERLERNPFFAPFHPALAILDWEDDRTDVHGIACSAQGRDTDDGPSLFHFTCHCGFETAKHLTEAKDDATAELVEHALTACAMCHGPKRPGNFPRCSGCAF